MEEDPAEGIRQGGGPGLATVHPVAWQEHILHLRAKDPSTGSRLHPNDQDWELRSQDQALGPSGAGKGRSERRGQERASCKPPKR